MLKYNISSSEDFTKLAEETERLAQHVEDVRQRMAAKRRRQRQDIQVVPAEPEQAPSKPEQSTLGGQADRPLSSPPPASPSSPSSSSSSPKHPDSGVFPVMQDRDAGRYCFVVDRKMSLDTLLPVVVTRPTGRKIPA